MRISIIQKNQKLKKLQKTVNIFVYILLILICHINICQLFADEIGEEYTDKITFGRLFHTFIDSQEHLISHPMISFGTGISQNNLPNRLNINSLHATNDFSFEYGFARIDSALSLQNIFAYSSELAYIESNTNKFGFFKKDANDVYDNEFSFGVGLRSGLGYKMNAANKLPKELYLLHSSSFLWSYFDYTGYNPQPFFQTYDDNYKFGWKGAAVVEARFGKNFFLDFEYEHNNIYSGFEFWQWTGSWLVDNILQRWIDFFDPVFIDKLGYSYPFLKFVYKNSISIILSEIRMSKQYFPFNSDYSLLQRRFNIRLRLIF